MKKRIFSLENLAENSKIKEESLLKALEVAEREKGRIAKEFEEFLQEKQRKIDVLLDEIRTKEKNLNIINEENNCKKIEISSLKIPIFHH